MGVTKILVLLSALGALADSSHSQTFVGVDFEQLAAPSGCIRNVTVPQTNVPSIPALKLQGVTISGGQVLSYRSPFQFTPNNVYYTLNSCAGVQSSITLTFDGPASNINFVVGQIWTGSEPLQVQDDQGGNQTIQLLSSNTAGQTIFLPATGIRKVTLTLPASSWTQGSPAGFYIDNIAFYLNQGLNFVDPVPSLMSGSGIVADPESLATMGTLVRAVAADGVARVLLTVQATHVGDVVNLSVLNDRGAASNSIQDDGGITTVTGSSGSKQQSIRVAAQDSSLGPMAFAIYYPPADFSRGFQDDQLASRTVQIQVDPQGPAPAYRRPLTILRPPVVLIHDLWESPADWDTFTSLINDPRFFIRRAAYNGVLGNRISSSIPAFPVANLPRARESALGLAYSAPLLDTQIAQYVNEFRLLQNAAAAQADVVVHGMGGVIARASIQLADYNAPESYSQGNVNKLVTIGTPHLGTPLATALLQNNNNCFANILASTGKFSFASATVDGGSVSGGIGDLQGNGFGGGLSAALAKIQQSGGDMAPTGPLAGLMLNANTSSLDGALSISRFIRRSCPGSPLASSLTSNGWAGVFNELSDAMVPLTSQLAGTFGLPIPGVVHSGGLEQMGFNPPGELEAQSPMGAAVIGLLNASARGIAFHPLP
jgi:hypothetical protein